MKKPLLLIAPLLLISACSLSFGASSAASASIKEESFPISSREESTSEEEISSLISSEESSSISSVSTEVDDPVSDGFRALFDYENDVRISMTFSQESLYALSIYGAFGKTYGDVYFPANLTISVNGVTSSYEEVGVKMKGNTTRRE
ncbi:MAG: hypothetical protein K5694_00405, partial [Bacilli bacterium]|nr:hypothetical protein [Bacilli bacterium]